MTGTAEETGGPQRHPSHEAIAGELRSWFTTSAPEIGYEVSSHWWGHLGRFKGLAARLILQVDTAGELTRALDEVRGDSSGELTIWVDDRERAGRLDSHLLGAGCRREQATTHLALVGEVRAIPAPADLLVEEVDTSSLERWASVKLRSFSDSEEEPSRERLEKEIGVRSDERALATYELASLHEEPVAVIGYYKGRDQLVFNLGTRLPYRQRGIAQALLARRAAAGAAAGARSLMINAHEGGRPAELYRRLGFRDEVYWYQAYSWPVPAPG